MAVGALLALTLAFAFAAPPAHAGTAGFCGAVVSQSALCRSEFGNGIKFIYAVNETNSNPVCVAPVGWNGGYTYPYGWQCAGYSVSWEFGPLNGYAAGITNPNSKAEKIGGLYGWL